MTNVRTWRGDRFVTTTRTTGWITVRMTTKRPVKFEDADTTGDDNQPPRG